MLHFKTARDQFPFDNQHTQVLNNGQLNLFFLINVVSRQSQIQSIQRSKTSCISKTLPWNHNLPKTALDPLTTGSKSSPHRNGKHFLGKNTNGNPDSINT
jgi:hypothetical protein